jgi:hypothetical protein
MINMINMMYTMRYVRDRTIRCKNVIKLKRQRSDCLLQVLSLVNVVFNFYFMDRVINGQFRNLGLRYGLNL